MSSWGNNDNAANAPYWAVNSTIVNAAHVKAAAAAPTAANVELLYANTQANAYTAGETIGLFAVGKICAGESKIHRPQQASDLDGASSLSLVCAQRILGVSSFFSNECLPCQKPDQSDRLVALIYVCT